MAVSIAPNLTKRDYTWTAWKAIYALKASPFQYDDDGVTYTLWFYDGPEIHACQIYKSSVPYAAITAYSQVQNDADKTDFEANYKNNGNKPIGNYLTNGSGIETGVIANPFVVTGSSGGSPELTGGKLFSATVDAIATTSGADNPILLLRNPVGSGKTLIIQRVLVNAAVINITANFKLFASPVFNSSTKTISSITQNLLSTTVTVTTLASHGAVVGSNVTISGTTFFNGVWTVTGVTSASVFTFTRNSFLSLISENSGSVVVESTVGTTLASNSLKRTASLPIASAIATSLPTVSSNGTVLMIATQGQNSSPGTFVEQGQVSLDPGLSLLFTADVSTNSRRVTITVIWAEV